MTEKRQRRVQSRCRRGRGEPCTGVRLDIDAPLGGVEVEGLKRACDAQILHFVNDLHANANTNANADANVCARA